MRRRFAALAAVLGLAAAAPAFAGHHLWDFTEVYSNSDGSVQYIEMIGGANNEQGLGPFTITAGANTLNFVTNLGSSLTSGKWVLVATSNFAGLPGGITPDYIIPGNFFATGGGTLNYAGGADVWAYGAVPTDGVLSLQRNGSTATNNPRNFAGDIGEIDLSGPVVPGLPKWGLLVLVGALLLAASGLLRRRENTIA
jgi:hypothetical protein